MCRRPLTPYLSLMHACEIDYRANVAKLFGMRSFMVLPLLSLVLLLSGCIQTQHRVETHHRIEPIHITVDVNLKVDRELNDFFGDLDEDSQLIEFEPPAE